MFDPSGDFAVFDGSETVTYSRPGVAPFSVVGVLRESMSTGEAAAGAALGLQPTDVPFNLPGPNLGGLVPLGGDTLVDAAGNIWVVISVQSEILTGQHRVVTRKGRS